MEVQWAEDEKLEVILEQRRERSSMKAEVTQEEPELVVHERMPLGEKARRHKRKGES